MSSGLGSGASAARIEPYLNVRSATTPAWLADDRLAYLGDASGVPQVWSRTSRAVSLGR